MVMTMLTAVTCGVYYDGHPGIIFDALVSLGPLGFDARDIFIGFISNIIVFPPIFLMIMLFKKGKCLVKRKNRIDITMEKFMESSKINWNYSYKRDLNRYICHSVDLEK